MKPARHLYIHLCVGIALSASGNSDFDEKERQIKDVQSYELSEYVLLDRCEIDRQVDLKGLILSRDENIDRESQKNIIPTKPTTVVHALGIEPVSDPDRSGLGTANSEGTDDDSIQGSEDIDYIPPHSTYHDGSDSLGGIGLVGAGLIYGIANLFDNSSEQERTCSDGTHRKLMSEQGSECSVPMKCKKNLEDCKEIRKNHEQFQKCIDARQRVIDECNDGKGDSGHTGAIQELESGQDACRDRFIESECDGPPLAD